MPDSATFEAIQTQELDEDSLLKDTLRVKAKGDEKLLDAEYMAVKSYEGNDQAFDMYRIVTDTTPDKTMSFTGMSLAPYELTGTILQDLRPANHSLEYTLNRILNGTDWRLGYIDDGLNNVTTTFYYVSVKEALKELQSLVGCEFVFKVEISGQKITDKWVEVYREMGNRNKKRFNYGTNALTVVRETNKSDIYTALIGRGKGEEVSSAEDNASGQAGYGRKITFEDIEWSTAKGDPLDKPIGQYYLELPQATQVYGIKNIDGTMKARVGIVDFDDEEDKNRLINLTYQQLLVSSRPKVLFKTTVANIGATGIGDTVTIHRHDLNMHYETRVRKVVRNKLNDNKTQIELGDAVVTPSTKRAKQNNATIKNLKQELDRAQQEITETRLSADGKTNNHYGQTEPERKRTGDTWYRPHPSIAGEMQMLIWDGNAWELILDTSDLASVSVEVKNIADKADNAVQAAIDADARANDALEKVGVNTDLISEHNNIIASLNGQLSDDLVTDQTVINPKTWLTNYGKLVANNDYDTTDYLPVGEGDSLSLESTVSHYYKLAFYDTDKNNLGYYDGSKVVLTPSGTAYFDNTAVFETPADGYVRLSYSTATGGANTVKLSNQNNLYTLINSGYNNALSALANANRAMQEFGENLISYDGLSRGYWLNAQGKLIENARYKTTDYIRVDASEKYKLTGGNAVYQVYFYDNDRNAIAYYDGKGIKTDIGTGLKYFIATPNIELIMPSNASYVRIASSIADFEQISFNKLSTIIANMFDAVDGMKQSVESDLSTVRNTANEAFDKANANGGKLSTVEQSVDVLKGEISQKVTSADVSTALNTFNETVKTQTASQITESLTGYAKSGDLTTIAQNIRTETAESLKSVYTKTETDGLLGGMSQKINSVQETADGNESLIAKIQETPATYLADYQKLINRADLVERTLGTTDSEVGDKVSRMVQTSGIIQTEVAEMDLATNTELTSKISQLSDNINLKVSSDDLLSQINVQAGGVLITSGTNKLNITPETTYIEDATIKSAMIESIEADKITTGTLDAGKIRVINLDANNITANKTSFVQSVWNSIESSIRIDSGGLLSTASDGSQVYLQNGILGVRRPSSEGGGTIGQIGYVYDGGSPTYTIQTTWGSNFAIKQIFYDSYTGGTKNKTALDMYTTDDGYSETTFRMSRINILGDAHLSFLFRHSINGSDNQRLTVNGAESVALRAGDSTIFAVSNNGSRNFASLHANLNMQGNTVTNTSDIRLKRDVVNDEIDSLSALMKWQHAGFYYTNPDMNQERQFSVIAQSAPDIAFAGEDGYLQVSLNKQVNMTSHALQQHVIKTNDEITRLKEQIANLQDELALLKGA